MMLYNTNIIYILPPNKYTETLYRNINGHPFNKKIKLDKQVYRELAWKDDNALHTCMQNNWKSIYPIKKSNQISKNYRKKYYNKYEKLCIKIEKQGSWLMNETDLKTIFTYRLNNLEYMPKLQVIKHVVEHDELYFTHKKQLKILLGKKYFNLLQNLLRALNITNYKNIKTENFDIKLCTAVRFINSKKYSVSYMKKFVKLIGKEHALNKEKKECIIRVRTYKQIYKTKDIQAYGYSTSITINKKLQKYFSNLSDQKQRDYILNAIVIKQNIYILKDIASFISNNNKKWIQEFEKIVLKYNLTKPKTDLDAIW